MTTPKEAEYDYIIVGSGAGGGPLAANLAKAGYKVVILEAGGDEDSLNYSVPAFNGLATEDEEYRWDYYVRHYSDQEQQEKDPKFVPAEDGILYPRASTVGGCTAHNALITVYPSNSDWDRIADLTGDPSWHSDNMRTYYQRLEHCLYIPPDELPGTRHGINGWLYTDVANTESNVPDAQLSGTILRAFDIASKQFGLGPLPDNDPNNWGVAEERLAGWHVEPLASNNGVRNGPREYIRQVQADYPDKLTVKTHALVSRILFDEALPDQNIAIGVAFLDGRNLYKADPLAQPEPLSNIPKKRLFAKREVILACGAFNTPQLLMLSGVGPADHLHDMEIPVRLDLPGVGQNLQDRYEITVVNEMADNWKINADCTYGEGDDPCLQTWAEEKSGPYTSDGVATAFLMRSQADLLNPDLYIFGLAARFRGYFPYWFTTYSTIRNNFTWSILKAHTHNTAGEVKLKSADPRDTPYVNFHYFDEGSDKDGGDMAAMVAAVKFARRLMRNSPYVRQEVLPGPEVQTDKQIRNYIRNQAWGHHCSCTAKIGRRDDPMAVIDNNFKVYGTKNLRVVDACVFPHIPGYFIVLPIYMISEKAADVILSEAQGMEQDLVERVAIH